MVMLEAYSVPAAKGSRAAVHRPFAMESPSVLHRNTHASMPSTKPIVLPMMRASIKLSVNRKDSAYSRFMWIV